jgi:hypothetical protein
MKRLGLFLLAFLLMAVTACAGGKRYMHTTITGETIVADSISHTDVARRGSTLTTYSSCNEDLTQCQSLGDPRVETNPTLFEQLAGPGATVGAAELVRRGLEESGDNFDVDASASAGASAKAGAKASGGCQGNCAPNGKPH